MIPIRKVIRAIEKRAPLSTAESWDAVGLLAGDGTWTTPGAVISDDLTLEAVNLANQEGAKLIVTHHPCFFPKSGGLSRLVAGSDRDLSTLVVRCLTEKIAVYACHTNFDQSALEVPAGVAKDLGFQAQGRLQMSAKSGLTSVMKLVTYIPATHFEKVREAVFEAGAGKIGNYDACSFSMPGEGTFRGGTQSNPFFGQVGVLEKAQEIRFETVLPRTLVAQVVQALKNSHPYEEVAYDLFPTEVPVSPRGIVEGSGYGVWGEFQNEISMAELTDRIKNAFHLKTVRVTGDPLASVKRVGFTPGAGGSMVSSALKIGCDVLITGELGYHEALGASRSGMISIELGHRESEWYFYRTMESWVQDLGLKAWTESTPTQIVYF